MAAFSSSAGVWSLFLFFFLMRLTTRMKKITAKGAREKKRESALPRYQTAQFNVHSLGFIMLTAESQHANQDPDGGSHPINIVARGGCYVAVAQLCAVTHFHWYGEETKTRVNQLEIKGGLL